MASCAGRTWFHGGGPASARSAAGFSPTPLVHGFSDTIAVGVAELPFDVPVEVEAVVELADAGSG